MLNQKTTLKWTRLLGLFCDPPQDVQNGKPGGNLSYLILYPQWSLRIAAPSLGTGAGHRCKAVSAATVLKQPAYVLLYQARATGRWGGGWWALPLCRTGEHGSIGRAGEGCGWCSYHPLRMERGGGWGPLHFAFLIFLSNLVAQTSGVRKNIHREHRPGCGALRTKTIGNHAGWRRYGPGVSAFLIT